MPSPDPRRRTRQVTSLPAVPERRRPSTQVVAEHEAPKYKIH